MIYKEKQPTVEAFQMTENHYNNKMIWPAWVWSAWHLRTTDVGSFHCQHDDPSKLYITDMSGHCSIEFGDFLIRPKYTKCSLGVLTSMSKASFGEKYEL